MGRIPDEDIQRVRDATDLIDLISESVVLKQKGRLYWGLCPFHGEKTPSFKVDPSTQLWHCFGCGEGGDVFGFLMRTEHLEFPDAVRQLADRANIEVHDEGGGVARGVKERMHAANDAAAEFYHRTLLHATGTDAQAARDYLKNRGFGIDVAKRFQIGYAPGRGALVAHLSEQGFSADEIIGANLGLRSDGGRLRDRFYERVMFPIRDVSGRAVGFGGRVLGSGEPKYLNTQETPVFHKSRNLYAIDRAKNPIVMAKTALVVEGYTDVIALHEAGIENAVATLGTALTREHVKMLGRFAPRIVYLFDADEAGLRAAERAVEFIDVSISPKGGRTVELAVALVPEGKDPADFVAARGAEGMRAVLDSAIPLMEFVIDRRMTAHDLDSPEGRARALADVATVLAAVKGTLLAQDYANLVADRLHTDFSTVMAAAQQARPAFAAPEERDVADEASEGPAVVGPVERAERELVAVIARSDVLRQKAQSLLESGLLTDDVSIRMLTALVEAGPRDAQHVVTALQSTDQQAAEVLSGLLVDSDGNEDVESVARELIGRLKEFAVERQIRQMKARMRSLDAVKDRPTYDELYKEIAALTVRLDEMRRGAGTDSNTEVWG